MSTLGDRIKLIRGKLSQAEFAERTGINRSTLGRYERNVNVPDTASINVICKEFNVDANWLLTGDEKSVGSKPVDTSDVPNLTNLEGDYITNLDDSKNFIRTVTNLDSKKYNFDILVKIREAYFEILRLNQLDIIQHRFDLTSELLYSAFVELSLKVARPFSIKSVDIEPIDTSDIPNLTSLEGGYITNLEDTDNFIRTVSSLDNKQFSSNILIKIREAYFEILRLNQLDITQHRFNLTSELLYSVFIELSLRVARPFSMFIKVTSYDKDGNIVDAGWNPEKS